MPIIHYKYFIFPYTNAIQVYIGFFFFYLLIIISKVTLYLENFHRMSIIFTKCREWIFLKSSSCYPLVLSRRANLQRCSVIRDLSDRTRQDMILTHRYNNKLANSFGGTPGIRVRQSRGSRVIACRILFILIGQLFILHLFQWLISVNMKPTRL